MKTVLKHAAFQISENALNELRATAGKSEQSRFVTDALRRELQ
jgi:hypothetical protein